MNTPDGKKITSHDPKTSLQTISDRQGLFRKRYVAVAKQGLYYVLLLKEIETGLMTDPYKKAIRTTLKQVRANTSIHYRSVSSRQVCAKIRTLESYRKAKHLALYLAINGEIDLTMLWKTAPLHGKQCYFPVVNEDASLLFLPATPATSFKRNRYGIEEPDVSRSMAISPEDLDLVIVPLVAFDIDCRRLGMGSGSYDRTFANASPSILLGAAYQFQYVDFIIPESWDVPLHGVVTEKAVYWR
jgi:5-formyltetrahydrofolate cyclo-ligase